MATFSQVSAGHFELELGEPSCTTTEEIEALSEAETIPGEAPCTPTIQESVTIDDEEVEIIDLVTESDEELVIELLTIEQESKHMSYEDVRGRVLRLEHRRVEHEARLKRVREEIASETAGEKQARRQRFRELVYSMSP